MAKITDYGSGHPSFLQYTRFISENLAYKGMPDVYNSKGNIQWEAPSNRSGGMFKDTHQKRLNWWREKANSLGIDPTKGDSWISRTAKLIHPTKLKPCKRCGREMAIQYAYPSRILLKRIMGLSYYDESFALDSLEHIVSLITRLIEHFGERIYQDLPKLLKVSGFAIPALPAELEQWLIWIEESYIPREPSILSPGAMSNAPDRFDGFHSFNRCCRESADPGRSKANLQSYATDRRVFEYWVDGDWVAANSLMGLIRSNEELKLETCLNGHPGPCSADHIGPISLGFAHRPEFQMLCKACNSAKNNRMAFQDVKHLIKVEQEGQVVCSWYIQSLWNACKDLVDSNETAHRLSKLFRDNRHTFMNILHRLSNEGHYTFLLTLQGLQYAEHIPNFQNLRVESHVTKFDRIIYTSRTTKYNIEQKSRRIRVAFAALDDYQKKPTRNTFVISTVPIEDKLNIVFGILKNASTLVKELDNRLQSILCMKVPSEDLLREFIDLLPNNFEQVSEFVDAKRLLLEAIDLISIEFSSMWSNDRYIRISEEEEDIAEL